MMGYNSNNYFPATYGYSMPNNPWQNNQQTQQYDSGINWVQGEQAAKSYMVRPNTTIPLWDSESQTIYLKSADASGMPSMRTLDYTFRDAPIMSNAQAPIESTAREVEYATKDDFVSLNRQLEHLQNSIKAISDMMQQKDDKQGKPSNHK